MFIHNKRTHASSCLRSPALPYTSSTTTTVNPFIFIHGRQQSVWIPLDMSKCFVAGTLLCPELWSSWIWTWSDPDSKKFFVWVFFSSGYWCSRLNFWVQLQYSDQLYRIVIKSEENKTIQCSFARAQLLSHPD
jgi:hypothetical protein